IHAPARQKKPELQRRLVWLLGDRPSPGLLEEAKAVFPRTISCMRFSSQIAKPALDSFVNGHWISPSQAQFGRSRKPVAEAFRHALIASLESLVSRNFIGVESSV